MDLPIPEWAKYWWLVVRRAGHDSLECLRPYIRSIGAITAVYVILAPLAWWYFLGWQGMLDELLRAAIHVGVTLIAVTSITGLAFFVFLFLAPGQIDKERREEIQRIGAELSRWKEGLPRFVMHDPRSDKLVNFGSKIAGVVEKIEGWIVRVPIENKPLKSSKDATVDVLAEISYRSANRLHKRGGLVGRWPSNDQPGAFGEFDNKTAMRRMHFEPGDRYDLDIAIKHKGALHMFAIDIGCFDHPGLANPDYQLSWCDGELGDVFVRVVLKGVGVDETPYWLRLSNPGRDGAPTASRFGRSDEKVDDEIDRIWSDNYDWICNSTLREMLPEFRQSAPDAPHDPPQSDA